MCKWMRNGAFIVSHSFWAIFHHLSLSGILDSTEGGRELILILALSCSCGASLRPIAFEMVANSIPFSKSLNPVLLWIPSSILGPSWVKCHSDPRCRRQFLLCRDPSIPTLVTSECLINQFAEKYHNSSYTAIRQAKGDMKWVQKFQLFLTMTESVWRSSSVDIAFFLEVREPCRLTFGFLLNFKKKIKD